MSKQTRDEWREEADIAEAFTEPKFFGMADAEELEVGQYTDLETLKSEIHEEAVTWPESWPESKSYFEMNDEKWETWYNEYKQGVDLYKYEHGLS